MAEDEVCCRCYGCDIHQHVCGLPREEAEQRRVAHDEVVGNVLRVLLDEGAIYVADDHTFQVTGY